MSHDAPQMDLERATSISGTHRRTLEKLFQHPLTHNLTLREVTRLFETIGTVDHRHNGDLLLTLNNEQHSLKPVNSKDLEANQVLELRHLLERAGWADQPKNQAF